MVWRFWKVLIWVLVAGTVLALIFGTQVYLVRDRVLNDPQPWFTTFLGTLPGWLLWSLFAPIIYGIALRFRFERSRWQRALVVHVPTSIAMGALQIVLPVMFFRSIGDPAIVAKASLLQHIMYHFTTRFHWNVLTYFGIVGLTHAVHYYRDSREKTLQASRIETRLVEAQLQALRMQLHPHFLFNSLNAISTLMHRDVAAADRMIIKLSDLLRLALENPRMQTVPLEEELRYLMSYLDIEKVRFQDRLEVSLDVPDALRGVYVPNLILQPLVENAIRHGIARSARPGKLRVEAREEGAFLHLSVIDSGSAEAGAGFSKQKGGIGLSNTKARLHHLYGDAQGFELHREPGGPTVAHLWLPVRRQPEASASEESWARKTKERSREPLERFGKKKDQLDEEDDEYPDRRRRALGS